MRGRGPFIVILIFGLLIPLALVYILAWRAVPAKLTFREISFDDVDGWAADGQKDAFAAFLKSCDTLIGRPGFGTPEGFRTETYARAFSEACLKGREGQNYYLKGDEEARAFFEGAFKPYVLKVGWSKKGHITGYYESLLHVSETEGGPYQYPLYGAPADQITIDLKSFRDTLSGTWVGRLEGKRVVPYFTRKQIEGGALTGRGLEILWATDPVDVYVLQVQGSGRGVLPGGAIIGIGYAGKNGHPNTLAGRTLVEMGSMTRDEVSMPAIRAWFEANPGKVSEVLNKDDSFVFFRINGDEGPFGSAGAELTPERSLAVDPKFIPLGLPVWVAGHVPLETDPAQNAPFDQLMIAQDTGGAIKGEIRGDVFWGFGDKAEYMAGHTNNEASFVLLIPNGADVPD